MNWLRDPGEGLSVVRFHVLKRQFQYYWKRKSVRATVVLLVLAATLLIQYVLANRPEPVELRATENKFTVPYIMPAQKLVVEVVDPSSGLLISHAGKLTEEVDVHLSNARLAPATLLQYEGDHPPASTGEIDCSPTNWHQQPQPGGDLRRLGRSAAVESLGNIKPCSTSISISLMADEKTPVELAFFQTDTAGREQYRHLVMDVRNEATVKLKMVPHVPNPHVSDSNNTANEEVDNRIVDCGRYLTVGEWHHRIGGPDEIESVMATNSRLRIRFTPLVSGALWSGGDGFFEPFSFGYSEQNSNNLNAAIKSRSVSIKSMDESKTIFSATSIDEGSLISIDRLRVGSDRLQVELTGTAFLTIDNELITIDLFERIWKYPVIAGFLAMANVAILTWFVKVVRSLFLARR